MTSPYAMLLSIAATTFGFILALVGVIADASIDRTPAVGDAMPHSLVATIAQDVRHADAVRYTVALESAASRPQARNR